VDLVDIDGKIVELAKQVPALAELNEQAFFDKRVTCILKMPKFSFEKIRNYMMS
jgi:spermidine synthase